MPPMPGSEPTPKLTYEDYCRIPDDGQRHEILDGVHFVSPSPLDRHQAICGNLAFHLDSFLRATRLGVLRTAPYARPRVLTLARRDALETPLLPELRLPLAEVFDHGLLGEE